MWAGWSWPHLQALRWVNAHWPARNKTVRWTCPGPVRYKMTSHFCWVFCKTCRCYACCSGTWKKGCMVPMLPSCPSRWSEHEATAGQHTQEEMRRVKSGAISWVPECNPTLTGSSRPCFINAPLFFKQVWVVALAIFHWKNINWSASNLLPGRRDRALLRILNTLCLWPYHIPHQMVVVVLCVCQPLEGIHHG